MVLLKCFSWLAFQLIQASAAQDVFSYLQAQDSAWNRDLCSLVNIPSISSLPEHTADTLEAAEWLKRRLLQAGLEHVQQVHTGAQPIVYGDHLHAGPDAPTVLIYGHYDVQPVDPLHLWHTPPFECQIQDGEFKGRGTDDDKGGLLQPVHAVDALLKSHSTLTVNVKFLLEGQEEIGSPNLDAALQKHKALFAADHALSADGGQVAVDQGGIPLTLRGAVAVEVELQTVQGDLHSGTWGGAVLNPISALAALLAGLHDQQRHVTVEGFYDGVRPIREVDRQDLQAFPFDEAATMRDLGASRPVGEEGYTTLERRWLRPTLDVVGIWGGFQGEGIKTIVPARASAKISCRLVPDQDPDHVTQALIAHLKRHAHPATTISVKVLPFRAHPFSADRNSQLNAAASKVLGKPTLFVREGGSIPAFVMMQRRLGLAPTSFGFGLPDDNLHAPNERYRLSSWLHGREAWVRILLELGNSSSSSSSSSGGGSSKLHGAASSEDRAEL